MTDPLGRTTRFNYGVTGDVTRLELPDGSAWTAVHRDGRPVDVTEAGGRTWRYAYDERGRVVSAGDDTGAVMTYAYDERGNLARTTDPLGGEREISYDAAGLPTAVTDASGGTITLERDALGRVVEMTDAAGVTTRFGWTVEGRLRWRESGSGARETWSWDGEGNLTEKSGPAGATRYSGMVFDLPSAVTHPDGAHHTFTYDGERRLVGVVNAAGQTWSYVYNAAGHLVSETDFNGRTLTYAYDRAGQLVETVNGAGQRTVIRRDILGQPVEERSDDRVTTFTHDANGNILRAVRNDVVLERVLDDAGRVLSERVGDREMSFQYDVLGRCVERRTPSGMTSAWHYDVAGRPERLDVAGTVVTFGFDALRRESTRSDPAASVIRSWDTDDRLASQTVRRRSPRGQDLLLRRKYAYRPDGFLSELDDLTTGVHRLGLDACGRVTAVDAPNWHEQYAYDAVGNTVRAVTPADLDEPGTREFTGTLLRRSGRTSYLYDGQGRVVRASKRLLNGQRRTRTFSWTADDLLAGTVTPDGTRWSYQYDALGRRVSKRCLGDDGEVAEEIVFVWEGSRLAEQITSGGCVTTWEYEPETYSPLAQLDREDGQAEVDARFHSIVTDLVGTPTELIDACGQVVWSRRSTVWGKSPETGLGSVTCPLRFPGQYADAETEWSYNFFRHYDPEVGRYATQDPLGLAASPNPDSYVTNPLVLSDPWGLAPCTTEQGPRALPPPRLAKDLRNSPGVVTGGSGLPDVEGRWLRGSHGNAGRIPGQVARALLGQHFTSFDKFREAFWKSVSSDPSLASQFDASGRTLMAGGKAPFTVKSQAVGKNGRYVLHHVQPIQHGGGVFDLDNLIVVTPQYHETVLDPTYHKG